LSFAGNAAASTPPGRSRRCGRQSEYCPVDPYQCPSNKNRPPSPELPGGWFDWIKPFFAITDDYVLNHCSLDGFFFLRFLRVLSIICLAGVCVVWPILLPVNGTGKSGLKELDSLFTGNIKAAYRYFAHVVVAWLFFGVGLVMICRQCIYFINVRLEYVRSPNFSKRLSSKTVLVTCIALP